MSKYFDKKDELFLEPQVKQYGGNFVMSNVSKPLRNKILNIDTRFCNPHSLDQGAVYDIILPERVAEVKSMSLTHVELPISFYNISAQNGNSSFQVVSINGVSSTYTIPDGQYDLPSLVTALNSAAGNDISFSIAMNTTITPKSKDISAVEFNGSINCQGFQNQNTILQSKLGWLLGFRKPTYVFDYPNAHVSEGFVDLNGPRYLYIAIDTFNNDDQHTFLGTTTTSELPQSIIARISLDSHSHPFGANYIANTNSGALLSDKRTYANKINIRRLQIQLLNEFGVPVQLNQMNFSFDLSLEFE
jgi:hypothetical protein